MIRLRLLERPAKAFAAHVLRRLAGARSRPYPPPESIRSILVVRQHNQLGDMLCVVPLLRALRARFPKARIALLASPGNRDVMLANRLIDEVVTYDKTEYLKDGRPYLGRTYRFLRALRKRRFDLAVVPATVSTSFSSDLLALATGAACRVGAASLEGVDSLSAFCFTRPVDLTWKGDPHRHQTLRNADIVAPFVPPPEDLSHEMTLAEQEMEEGRRIVEEARGGKSIVVAIHPGAGKPPNRWPAERFAAVANSLADRMGARIFVTCGPMDELPVNEVCAALNKGPYVIKNEPIRRVASILRYVDLLISNDTGIMHVGAAVGAPVLSIFGPTDPLQWAPIGKIHRFIHAESGDIGAIPVERVLKAAGEMLGHH